MKPLSDLREKAIRLRRGGLTYSEILEQVPVARSSLSLWLRSVGLSKPQVQRITEKKLLSARRGGEAKRKQRIANVNKIRAQASKEVEKIDRRDLWLIGIALYWAEGSKDKDYKPGTSVVLSNSDPLMAKVFLKWLKDCVGISSSDIDFSIYIHETRREDVGRIREYWSTITGFPEEAFTKLYFKRHKLSRRRNQGEDYHGLIRIRVRRSTWLNRKLDGWIAGICQHCGVV